MYKYVPMKSLSPLGLVWIDTRRLTHSAQSLYVFSVLHLYKHDYPESVFLYYLIYNTLEKNIYKKFGPIVSSMNSQKDLLNLFSVLLQLYKHNNPECSKLYHIAFKYLIFNTLEKKYI